MQEKEYKPGRKTTPELAKDYNLSERSIRRMRFLIKDKIGDRKGHYNSPEQVEIFVREYGRPWILIPFIWLTNVIEAQARQSSAANYTELPALAGVNHDGKAFPNDASDVARGILHPVTWIAAILLIFFNVRDLARSYNSHWTYSGNNLLRRIRAMFLIAVGSGVFVAAGYFIGLMIF